MQQLWVKLRTVNCNTVETREDDTLKLRTVRSQDRARIKNDLRKLRTVY
jgi:hypothetical protein